MKTHDSDLSHIKTLLQETITDILERLKEQDARLDFLEDLLKNYIEITRNLRNEG